MNLSEALKKWARENLSVKEAASDEDYRKALGDAIAGGKLSVADYTKMAAETGAGKEDVSDFEKKLDTLIELQKKQLELATAGATKGGSTPEPEPAKSTEPEPKTPERPEWHRKMTKALGQSDKSPLPRDEFGEVRVKGAWENYRTEKSALMLPQDARTKSGSPHPMAGQRLAQFGVGMDSQSELEKAHAGVWAKFQILSVTPKLAGSADRAWEKLTEHERELLWDLCERGSWDDSRDGRPGSRRGYQGGIKALIDDATSGGLEAAPIVFDDMVIQTPLLYGELYPLVNTVPLDRGRRIEGVATGTVTGGWGGVDDSAISLFTTTSYVSAFDTTIYRWEGAVRIGLDFLSDTPIDFSNHITQQYGERLLEDLDDVIAVGNGTTQPEGVMNKSGVTSVAFGGANSIGNIESLRFGVAKAEHRSTVANSAVFCGTETTYQRWRALSVGGSDARRLFGIDHFGPNAGGYMIDGARFAINESMANTQAFYAILARYRMYRRRGLTIRTSTEGDTLIRNNELLIVAMARYGGQLERGACAAVSTTLPA